MPEGGGGGVQYRYSCSIGGGGMFNTGGGGKFINGSMGGGGGCITSIAQGWGGVCQLRDPPTHTHSKDIGNCFVMLGLQYVRGFEGGGGGGVSGKECSHLPYSSDTSVDMIKNL